ncbi:DUF1877 family protein [Chondrinema litorale]|uniref:DUF1877 family protein n=1 Tax=Chondrinema litorale TaxID=2994555 RepID=UPI0025436CD6|nr:DUF1877 family protein [Chondrinema litorale]UZR95291.1 DUF1877 family protein [Chondrinema litorale]
MGIVKEYYRVEDKMIDYFVQNPEEASDYFDNNYCFMGGKYHDNPERHFYLDKSWDEIIPLLIKCDNSENNIVKEINGISFRYFDDPFYIKSELAAEICDALQLIVEEDLREAYNISKMKSSELNDDLWKNYFLLYINKLKAAFQTAKRFKDGIVINAC